MQINHYNQKSRRSLLAFTITARCTEANSLKKHLAYMFTTIVSTLGIIISTCAGGIFIALKYWVDKVEARKIRRVELLAETLPESEILELEISNVLNDPVEAKGNLKILCIEEKFTLAYGKQLSIEEIRTLLTARSPQRAFSTYIEFHRFLCIENNKVHRKKEFKKESISALGISFYTTPVIYKTFGAVLLAFSFLIIGSAIQILDALIVTEVLANKIIYSLFLVLESILIATLAITGTLVFWSSFQFPSDKFLNDSFGMLFQGSADPKQ